MAPEQTGRMNRSIDPRSDLYSLGATFYEMLTGAPPFGASDPMELIHCHIARQPIPPHERIGAIPEQISSIVMKLLAKTMEERRQTAAGVEVDLRQCLTEWHVRRGTSICSYRVRATSPIDCSCRNGCTDVSGSWKRWSPRSIVSSPKAYPSCSARVRLSRHRQVVGGQRAAQAPMVPAAAPCPQPVSSIGTNQRYPLRHPGQAFQSLTQMMLGRSEAELARWRDALRSALGPNGSASSWSSFPSWDTR